MWPEEKRAISISSTASSWPTTALADFAAYLVPSALNVVDCHRIMSFSMQERAGGGEEAGAVRAPRTAERAEEGRARGAA
jgi:hypothetical protein